MPDFIPGPDGDALLWMEGFLETLQENMGVYSVSEVEVETLSDALSLFRTALRRSRRNMTRTPGQIGQKDVARNNAEGIFRFFASKVRANRGLTMQAKLDIGIRPPGGRTAIGPPETSPIWRSSR